MCMSKETPPIGINHVTVIPDPPADADDEPVETDD